MLEFAKKYEDQLKQIYYDNILNDKLKWLWLGPGRNWIEPQQGTDDYHSFVSTYKGNVIGEMGYHVNRLVKKADGLYCCHFTEDNGFIFMKDLITCLTNVFEKFGFNKLSYFVAVGNPIENKWDKLTYKFGGRIIGIRQEDVILQDGYCYDIKDYEILAKNYFYAKGMKGQ